MNTCAAPLDLDSLIQYWLGELDDEHEAAVESHYSGCAACTERLEEIVALGDGVRRAFAAGLLHTFITPEFATRLKQQGLSVREYRVPAGGSVNCSVGPEDDAVLGRLEAPLAGVERLDAIIVTNDGGRMMDIPFDPVGGEVVMASSLRRLRALPACREIVRLVAVGRDGERVLGEYTFNHSPCD
jgi:hypothetical protein